MRMIVAYFLESAMQIPRKDFTLREWLSLLWLTPSGVMCELEEEPGNSTSSGSDRTKCEESTFLTG
ncbi:hypothetical protein QCA50_007504 [Cerrena zonata]|uniref:Uncharacterized protein n=1 Tax=Cerrena zonata TaxID=2478898 RepID=A0AAW0G5S3_9APHY